MLKRLFASVCFLLAGLALFPSIALAQSPVITITTGIVGEVIPVAGSNVLNIPDNFLACNGGSYSASTYWDLYNVIGCQYGCPDGSHFIIPDCRERFIRGDDGYSEGDTGGEAYHTLTVSEMPSHNHTFVDTYAAWVGSGGRFSQPSGGAVEFSGYLGRGYTNNRGGGQPHNNLPPYVDILYLIRYQQDVITFTLSSTATPIPTNTPTPTATPTGTVTIYLPQVDSYTHTLRSGKTYTVPQSTTFGQIFAVGAGLMLATTLVIAFAFRLVYRQ